MTSEEKILGKFIAMLVIGSAVIIGIYLYLEKKSAAAPNPNGSKVLPDNFSSLPKSAQEDFIAALQKANLWSAQNPINPYE